MKSLRARFIAIILTAILAASLISCAATVSGPGKESLYREGEIGTDPAGPATETELPTDTEPAAEPATETDTAPATDTGAATETEPADTTPPDVPPEINYDVNAHLGSNTVLIDAGHGYADPGCTSKYLGGVYEMTITYDMACLLRDELSERGYSVVMLRDGESFPNEGEILSRAKDLGMFVKENNINENNVFHAYERTLWADVMNRDTPFALMISLHVNSLPSAEEVRGTEIYHCVDNGCAAPSELLATIIEEHVRSDFGVRVRRDGTVWSDSYIVTKWTEMPSVLVEMAYATNPDDAKLLFDKEWRKEYVDTLADSIDEYMSKRG